MGSSVTVSVTRDDLCCDERLRHLFRAREQFHGPTNWFGEPVCALNQFAVMVNKAAEGKDTLNWLMDYATPGFFDDSGTYDSSYGNMTKGEMDMYQTKSTISSLSAQPFQPDDPLVTTNDPWCCVGSKTALRGRGSRARPISLPVTARLSRYGIA